MTQSNTVKKKGEYISDTSLGPNGKLSKRLFDPIKHMPSECPSVLNTKESKNARPKCQLHNWFQRLSRDKIMYCKECNVNLCIDCYSLFHTEPNLVKMKTNLCAKYDPSKRPVKKEKSEFIIRKI